MLIPQDQVQEDLVEEDLAEGDLEEDVDACPEGAVEDLYHLYQEETIAGEERKSSDMISCNNASNDFRC